MSVTFTEAEFAAALVAIDKLEAIHDCASRRNWIISNPGFRDTHAGMSVAACYVCQPAVIALFEEHFGGHDIRSIPPP